VHGPEELPAAIGEFRSALTDRALDVADRSAIGQRSQSGRSA